MPAPTRGRAVSDVGYHDVPRAEASRAPGRRYDPLRLVRQLRTAERQVAIFRALRLARPVDSSHALREGPLGAAGDRGRAAVSRRHQAVPFAALFEGTVAVRERALRRLVR